MQSRPELPEGPACTSLHLELLYDTHTDRQVSRCGPCSLVNTSPSLAGSMQGLELSQTEVAGTRICRFLQPKCASSSLPSAAADLSLVSRLQLQACTRAK